MRLLGLDPGLRCTGWGIIESQGNRLRFIGAGSIQTDQSLDLAERLSQLFDGIADVIVTHRPQEAAVEESFVNKNPASTLKLGQARGIVLLCPARAGLKVAEYPPNLIKKTVVGTGHAAKQQVRMMVKTLLPGAEPSSQDAADALATAICHAHFRANARNRANAVENARGSVRRAQKVGS